MKIQVLFVLVIICWLAVVSAKTPDQFYCGRKLADTLAYLCPADMEKRGGENMVDYDYDYGWPWMSAQRAQALEGRGKRGGVVSECCEKACSIEELMSYC